MKTKEQITLEITAINSDLITNSKYYKKSKINKLKNKIEELRTCILYVEHNPREEFVLKMKHDLETLIDKLLDKKRYEHYCKDNFLGENAKSKAKYLNSVNHKKYKDELRAINYILS